jgi:hypothetical protein
MHTMGPRITDLSLQPMLGGHDMNAGPKIHNWKAIR